METLYDYTTRLRALPPGTVFTRVAAAMASSRGDLQKAAQLALAWPDTPQVASICKAAVAAGGINTWGANLVDLQVASAEILQLVQPRSVLGRLQRVKRVAFLTQTLKSSGAIGAGWVVEGAGIPLRSLNLDRVALSKSMIASIVVVSQELARAASPASEGLLREEIIASIASYTDRALLDPSIAASADNPASLTNGATMHHSTGSSVAQIESDLSAVVQMAIDAGSDMSASAWAIHPRTALFLTLARDVSGARAFPAISVQGGTLLGIPALVSAALPISGSPGSTLIALLDGSRLLLADDGEATIFPSDQGTVQLSDSPAGGPQTLVSLWQNFLTSFRVHREINFQAGDESTCVVLDQVNY